MGAYDAIIEFVFFKHYMPGMENFDFWRSELSDAAVQLSIPIPSNIGDILYTYRYRDVLPESIRKTAPVENEWHIYPVGRGVYRFVLKSELKIVPNTSLATTKIPDATPGIIRRFAQGDEQDLLAVIRYNRLVDIFTGLTCYSLQSHLRTTVSGLGQVETDELYVGIDRRGAQYVIPVQAKGGSDILGRVQIEQDIALCEEKFPALLCRPIAAQFIKSTNPDEAQTHVVAMFELRYTEEGLRIVTEKRYRLVQPFDLSDKDIKDYQTRSLD